MEKKKFIEAYQMLPQKYLEPLKEEIKGKCGWNTDSTFHRKRLGTVRIRLPERQIIEEVFAKYNINAWTGEYIKQLAV